MHPDKLPAYDRNGTMHMLKVTVIVLGLFNKVALMDFPLSLERLPIEMYVRSSSTTP